VNLVVNLIPMDLDNRDLSDIQEISVLATNQLFTFCECMFHFAETMIYFSRLRTGYKLVNEPS